MPLVANGYPPSTIDRVLGMLGVMATMLYRCPRVIEFWVTVPCAVLPVAFTVKCSFCHADSPLRIAKTANEADRMARKSSAREKGIGQGAKMGCPRSAEIGLVTICGKSPFGKGGEDAAKSKGARAISVEVSWW